MAPIIEPTDPARPSDDARAVGAAPAEETAADAPSAVPAAADTPAAAQSTPASSRADEAAPDAEALRGRDQVRDQVFRSRTGPEIMKNAVSSTTVAFELHWKGSRRYRLDKAELRLDGTRLWDATERPVNQDPIKLAERAAAPGRHVLTVRLEVQSRDKVPMGYSSEQNFFVHLPEGKVSRLVVSVDEDGNLPSYNPEVKVKVDN